MESIDNEIIVKIKSQEGFAFFIEDFLHSGTSTIVHWNDWEKVSHKACNYLQNTFSAW